MDVPGQARALPLPFRFAVELGVLTELPVEPLVRMEGLVFFAVGAMALGTPPTEGLGDDMTECRLRQTSFIIFSSSSLHSGTMWSSSSLQTIRTRSSRCK